MTDGDYEAITKEYKGNRKQMEAIVAVLMEKKELSRFIGLSAVYCKYAETTAKDVFPFIDELGDRHPIKGNLKLQRNVFVVCVRACNWATLTLLPYRTAYSRYCTAAPFISTATPIQAGTASSTACTTCSTAAPSLQ